MEIAHENIEVLIFDYFEGNLSDNDKAQLLNFIHLHPEYERDFALWAQTYAHVNETVPSYGLANTLIRSKPAFIPLKKVFYWGGTAIIIGGTAWAFLFLSGREKSNSVIEQTRSNAQMAKTKEAITPQVSILKEEQKKETFIKDKKTKKAPPQIINIESEKSGLADADTLTKIETQTLSHPVVTESDVKTELEEPKIHHPSGALPDTTRKVEMKVSSPEKVKTETKKNKKRLPLNLKPNSDFMPVNSNF